MTDLVQQLEAARATAFNGGLPIRRKDGTLYRLLAECLAICEVVHREGREKELREIFRVSVSGQGNEGRGRKYAEAGSDVFILVTRYVMPGDELRSARSRYAHALREASKRQLSSQELASWLSGNGGVNSLFLSRPLNEKTVTTKTLHLNSSIEIPKGEPIRLVLQRDFRGFYNVLEAA